MKQLLFVLFLLWNLPSFCQFDTLVLVNGTKKAVILKEIGNKDVKYKLPADSLGATYVIKKKMVEKFILRNGCIDLKDKGYENCEKDPTFGAIQGKDFTRTIISADLMQLVAIQHVQFGIEHILKNRKAGIELYYNLGLTDRKFKLQYDRKEITINPVRSDSGAYYKYNYAGVNIKFYPFTHKKMTYWIAVGGEMGKASTFISTKHFLYASGYNGNSSSYVTGTGYTTNYYETGYSNYHINNGFNLRGGKHFVLQLHADMGINFFKNPETKKMDSSFKYGLGLKIGVAF